MPIFESLPRLEARSRPVAEQGFKDFKALPLVAKPPVAVAGVAGGGFGALRGLVKTPGVAAREFWDYSFGDRRGKGIFNYVVGSPLVQMGVTAVAAEGVGAALRSVAPLLAPVNDWLASVGIVNGVQGVLGFGNGSTLLAGALTFLGAYAVRALPRTVTLCAPADAGRTISTINRWLGRKPAPVTPPAPQPTLPPTLAPVTPPI